MPNALKRIGRFDIKGRIGGGGMGTLYLALDTNPTTSRLVALKLLRANLDSDELRRRFELEAQALAQLRHPNIVIIYDSGEYDESPFIVMEFIRGETLAEIIERRAQLSIADKLDLLVALCQGLGSAHDEGFVHRDIKPANLMLDRTGPLKILDFGIARSDDLRQTLMGGRLTRLNAQIGTPGYMPPEQIEGLEADARSDVFAVGAVAYELLSYQPAFKGQTAHQVEKSVFNDQPAPLDTLVPGLDPQASQIVLSALEKDPVRRCPDVATLGRALAQARGRLGAQESQRPTPARRPSGASRSRHERSADVAYEAAIAARNEGGLDFAKRSAMEALAELPSHAGARQLLRELGKFADVQPWLPATATPPEVDLESTLIRSEQETNPAPQPRARTPLPTPTILTPASNKPVFREPPPKPVAPGSAPKPTLLTPTPRPVAPPSRPTVPTPSPAAYRSTPPVLPSPPVVPAPPQPAAVTPRSTGPGSAQRSVPRWAVPAGIVGLVLITAGVIGWILLKPPPPQSESFSLTFKPPVGGTIAIGSTVCGGDPATCTQTFPKGQVVRLVAQASPEYDFREFTGDCKGTEPDRELEIKSETNCSAEFTPKPPPTPPGSFRLSLKAQLGGIIEGDGFSCRSDGRNCDLPFPGSKEVTLRARADENYKFDGWQGGCATQKTPAAPERLKFKLNADLACTAMFTSIAAVPPPPAALVDLTVALPEHGSLVSEGLKCGHQGTACQVQVTSGTTLAIQVVTERDYVLESTTCGTQDGAQLRLLLNQTLRCNATFVRDKNAPPANPKPRTPWTNPKDGLPMVWSIPQRRGFS